MIFTVHVSHIFTLSSPFLVSYLKKVIQTDSRCCYLDDLPFSYLTTPFQLYRSYSIGCVDYKSGTMSNEMVVAYFKVLFQHSLGGIEENNEVVRTIGLRTEIRTQDLPITKTHYLLYHGVRCAGLSRV